jgi:membrane protein implicated in regulation of membrane protease activity
MLLYFAIMSIGVVLLLGSLVLGELLDVFDFGDGAGPLSGPVLGVGLTAFGATGLLTNMADWPTLLGAITSAVSALGFGAIGWWMMAVIHRQTGSTSTSLSTQVGRIGEVTTRISADGIGEVRLTRSDSTSHVLARSRDGLDIPTGTVVRVVQVLGNSVIVEPAEPRKTTTANSAVADQTEE